MALAEARVAGATGDVLLRLRVVGLTATEWLTMDFLLIAMMISLKVRFECYNDLI
jgi:hypothetical protein